MGFHLRLATSLTLTSAVTSIKFQARHDGKSHQAAHDVIRRDLRPRQVNGPAGGTPALTSTAAISSTVSSSTPIDTVDLSPAHQSTPSTVNNSSGDPMSGVNNYIFPTTLVQVPVATICPNDTASILPLPTANVVNATAFLPNGSSTIYLSSTTSSFLTSTVSPAPLPGAISGCYPDLDPDCPTDAIFTPTPVPVPSAIPNNSTVHSTRTIANPTARILLGDNGCQTIYSPSYTAICMTTVKMAGLPDATVTECDQYITFSRAGSNKEACRGDAATPRPATTTAIGATAAQPITVSDLVHPEITTTPRVYYAAHWYDLAKGGVPRNVRIEECAEEGGAGGSGAAASSLASIGVSCDTYREKWSESHVTGILEKTSTVEFMGPAIITKGTQTLTTTISLRETSTITITTVFPTVIKSRVGISTTISSYGSSFGSSTTAVPTQMVVTLSLERVNRPNEECRDGQGKEATTQNSPDASTVAEEVAEGVAEGFAGDILGAVPGAASELALKPESEIDGEPTPESAPNLTRESITEDTKPILPPAVPEPVPENGDQNGDDVIGGAEGDEQTQTTTVVSVTETKTRSVYETRTLVP